MRQQSFFKPSPLFHGGELALKKRKSRRPFDAKRALHLVLKAESPRLFASRAWIEKESRTWASRFHLKVYELAVNFDHLHLVVRAPTKRLWNAFLRALAGRIAAKLGAGLWALLPFSRVVAWGRDFKATRAYVRKNYAEASGERPYEKRKDWYQRHKRKGAEP